MLPDSTRSDATVTEPAALRPAWDPFGIAVLGFFLSILPAGILQAVNYDRLGAPERVFRSLAFNLTAAGILFAAAVFTDLPSALFVVFNLFAVYYFRESQRELYRRHLSRGGPKASFRRPIVYSVAGFVLVVLGLMGGAYYASRRDQNRFTQALHLMEAQRYHDAELIFKDYQATNPDDIASYWDLALIYLRQADTGLAIQQLRAALRKHPSDTAAAAFLHDLLTVTETRRP